MKLHLPSGLRAALFACFAAFAGIGTTLSTATITGGMFAVTALSAASIAEAANYTSTTGGQIKARPEGGNADGSDDVALDSVAATDADGNRNVVTLDVTAGNRGWFNPNPSPQNYVADIVINNLYIEDGSTPNEGQYKKFVFSGSVSGSGNFESTTGIARQHYVFSGNMYSGDDASNESAYYKGTIKIHNTSHILSFVNETDTTRAIRVAAMHVNGKLEFDGGYEVYSNLNDINTLAILGGTTTLHGTSANTTTKASVAAGAILAVGSSGALTLNGTTTIDGGLSNSGGACTLNGAVSIGAGASFDGAISLNGAVTLAAPVANSGALTFGADATLDLSALSVPKGEQTHTLSLFTEGSTGTVSGLTMDKITGIDLAGYTWSVNENGTITYTAEGDILTYSGGELNWVVATDPENDPFPFEDGDLVLFTGDTVATIGGAINSAFVEVQTGTTLTLTNGGVAENRLTASGIVVEGKLVVDGNVLASGTHIKGDGVLEFTGLPAVPANGANYDNSVTFNDYDGMLSDFEGDMVISEGYYRNTSSAALANINSLTIKDTGSMWFHAQGLTFEGTINIQDVTGDGSSLNIDGATVSGAVNITGDAALRGQWSGTLNSEITGAGNVTLLSKQDVAYGAVGLSVGGNVHNDGDVIIGDANHGATVKFASGATLANSGDVIVNGGTASFGCNVAHAGELVLNGGRFQIGSSASSTNSVSFSNLSDFEVRGGATFSFNHAYGDFSSINLTLQENATLEMFDSNVGNDVPIADPYGKAIVLGRVTVDGNATLSYYWKGAFNITELTGTAKLTLSGAAQGNDPRATIISSLKNYNGEISGTPVKHEFYLDAVHQDAGYSAVIKNVADVPEGKTVGTIYTTNFSKTGAGKLVLVADVAVDGILTMNYEGELFSAELAEDATKEQIAAAKGISIASVANGSILSYTSADNTLSLAYGTISSLTSLTVDLLRLRDALPTERLDLGITGVTDDEATKTALKGILNVNNLADGTWDLDIVDGKAYLLFNEGAKVSTLWDLNWGEVELAGAPEKLTPVASLGDESIVLGDDASPYLAGDYTAIVVNGGGGESAILIGGKGAASSSLDSWISVQGGTWHIVAGGNKASNYSGGTRADFNGDSHIMMTDGTVYYIIGANFQDGDAGRGTPVQFNGDTYISVKGGTLGGSIIGGGNSQHSDGIAITGDSNIYVYTPLSTNADKNLVSVKPHSVVGGSVHSHNTLDGKSFTRNGDTKITIDLSEYEGSAQFVKTLIGGDLMHYTSGALTSSIDGNTNITVDAKDATAATETVPASGVTFNQVIVGGTYVGNAANNSSASISGQSAITISGGTFSGEIIGGMYLGTKKSSSTVGSTNITLTGGTYSKGIIGGTYVGNAADDSSASISGQSAITISGGTFSGEIIGGMYLGTKRTSSTVGSTNITLTGGTYSIVGADSNSRVSKGIVGGTFIGSAGNGTSAAVTGDTNIMLSGGTIGDGTHVLHVIGGMLSSDDYTRTGYTVSVGGKSCITLDGATLSANANIVGASYLGSKTNSATYSHGGSEVLLSSGSVGGYVTGGYYINGNSGTTFGTASLGDVLVTVDGATVDGELYGGSVNRRKAAAATLSQGAVAVELQGGTVGNVYAAGSQEGTSTMTTASTSVSVGADMIFRSGSTVSGGYKMGTGAANATVTGSRTLVLTDNADYSNLSGVTLADFNAIEVQNAAANITLSQALTSLTGSAEAEMTKLGAGKLTLSAADTAGKVKVQEGTLALNGKSLTSITVLNGATLDGSAAGSDGGALTLGAAAGDVVKLNVGSGMALDSLALTAGSKIEVQGMAAPEGDYTLTLFTGLGAEGAISGITFGGEDGNVATLADYISNAADFVGGELILTANGDLVISSEGGAASWYWTAEEGNVWTEGTTTESGWGEQNDTPNGKRLVFGDITESTPAAQTYNVAIVGDVTPDAIVVNANEDSYVFSGDSIIGDAALKKSGSGTLTLENANTSTGSMTISGGTVNLGSANGAGSWAGDISVTEDGMLHIVDAGNTVGNAITATGAKATIEVDGSAEGVTLAKVSGGNLIANTGSGNVTITDADDATFSKVTNTGTGTLTFGTGITMAELDNNGTIKASGSAVTITGGTTNGGILDTREGAYTPGTVTLGGNSTFASLRGGWVNAGTHKLTLTGDSSIHNFSDGSTNKPTVVVSGGTFEVRDGGTLNLKTLALSAESRLSAAGSVSVEGDVTSTAAVGTLADGLVAGLHASGAVTVGGMVTVDGSIAAGGKVTIGTYADVEGSITSSAAVENAIEIGTNVNVAGSLKAVNADSFADVTSGGNIKIGGNAEVGGDIWANWRVDVEGNATVEGDLLSKIAGIGVKGDAEVGGSLGAVEAVVIGGTATIRGSLSGGNVTLTKGGSIGYLEDGTVNTAAGAGNLTVGAEGTLSLGGALKVAGTISGVTNIVVADNLLPLTNNAPLVQAGSMTVGDSLTLSFTNRQNVLNLGLDGHSSLESENSYTLIAADTALCDASTLEALKAKLTLVAPETSGIIMLAEENSFVHDAVRYTLGVSDDMKSIVIKASYEGCDWVSTDGVWDNSVFDADAGTSDDWAGGRTPSATTDVVFNGNTTGTSSVKLVGDVTAQSVLIDTAATTDGLTAYAFSSDSAATIDTQVLTIKSGELTIGGLVSVGSAADALDSVALDANGALIVAEGGSLYTQAMEVNAQQEVTSLVIPGGEPVTTTRGFFNHGTTVVSGALTVGSGSKMGDPIDRVEIINEGVLKVGSGSVLGAVLGEGSFYATYASAEEVQVDKIDSDGVAGSVGAQHVEAQGAKLMLGAATGSGKEGSALVADSVLVTASGSGIVGSFPAYGELTVNGIVDNFHTISALDGSSVSVTGLADDGLSLAVTNVNALEASGTNSLLNVGETAFLKSVEKGGTTVAPSVTASGKNSHVILAGLALESPATETGKLKAEGENARIDLFGMVVGTYDIELGTGASIAAQGSDLTVNLLSSTGSLSALNNTVTLLQKTSSGGSVDVKSLDLSAASGSTFTSVKTGALTLDLSALWADGTKGQPLLTTGSLERSEVVDSLTLNLGSSFTDAAANLLAVGSTFGAAGVDAANNVAYTDYTLISGASLKDFTFTVENAEDLQQAFALQEAYALVKVENGNLVLRVYDDSEGREWNSDNPGWVGNQNNNSGDVLDVVPGSPAIDATLRVPTYQMFDTVDKVTVSDAYTIDLSATAGADQASELEVGKQLATATDAAAGLLISNLNGTGSLTIKGDGATLAEGGTDINTIDRVTILANELTTAENLSYSGKLTLESVDAIVRSEDGAAVTAGSMELNSAALTNEGLLSTGAVALSGSDSSLTNKNTLTAGDVTLSGAGASLTNEAGTLTAGSVTLSNATATLASTGGTTKVASLNGTAGKIGGTIIVTGTGGNYSGGYDAIAAAPGAEIKLAGGASQALTAGDGLTVSTHGTADDNRAAVTLSGTTMDAINVSHADVTLADMNTLTVQELSSMAGGSLAFKLNAGDVASGVHGTSPVIISSETYMTISGTTLKVTQADTAKQTSTFDVTKGTTGLTLVTLVDGGATALTKEDIDCTDFSGKGDNFFTSEFFNRYFDWESVVVEDGKVKADLVTDYYTKPLALTENGTTGLQMLDIVDLQIDPQGNADKYEDLAGVIGALKDFRASGNADAADRLASAVAGSGVASLGMALAGDVERQLKAIRNRTTTMGVDPSVVNEDMPYFNAWINAEGDHRSLDEDSTYAGYSLSSWGGTIGFDMDVNPSLTWGLALTAMYGDFTAESADVVEGDVSSYYVSAFARAMSGAWVHTFVATVGMSWTDVSRTVSYRGGSYTAEGDADGISFGFLYEVARTFALNEDATACWQPVFNVAFRHTQVDGYTETGSDAALSLGDQTLDTVTFGFGGRVQAVVGENIYNRTSVFEARALIKLDAGDRESEMDTALINASAAKGTVRSAEMDAFGIELGAGITVPVGMESGSIFMDGSIEFRDCYTSANATLGYRVNF